MSVLVDLPTLVVRKSTLAALYPGGFQAWVERQGRPGTAARYVSQDEHLVGVGFSTHELRPEIQHLESLGMVFIEGETFIEFAVVDPHQGPAGRRCPWLSWQHALARRTDVEFVPSRCWLAGSEPGDLAVPEGWIPVPPARRRIRKGDAPDTPMMAEIRAWLTERELECDVRFGSILVGSVGIGLLDAVYSLQGLAEEGLVRGSLTLPLRVPLMREKRFLDLLNADGVLFRLEPMTRKLVLPWEAAKEASSLLSWPEILEQRFAWLEGQVRRAHRLWWEQMEGEVDVWGVADDVRVPVPAIRSVFARWAASDDAQVAGGAEGGPPSALGEPRAWLTEEEGRRLLGEDAFRALNGPAEGWSATLVAFLEDGREEPLDRVEEGRQDGKEAPLWMTEAERLARMIRASVASNPALPSDVREWLSVDPSGEVRAALEGAAGRARFDPEEVLSDSPEEDFEQLPLDQLREDLSLLLQRPLLPPDLLRALARGADPWDLYEIAGHPCAPPDLLRALARVGRL